LQGLNGITRKRGERAEKINKQEKTVKAVRAERSQESQDAVLKAIQTLSLELNELKGKISSVFKEIPAPAEIVSLVPR
jgi:Tfp pilus assembly protein PilO